MGADAATSLGVEVHSLRRNLFLVTSLIAGLSVAVSGVIGFVGLVVPHIVRLIVGSDHRRMLPVGVLVGATFMVLSDLLARTIVAPQEMPIGVITAIIGAPTLIVLIRRRTYLYGARLKRMTCSSSRGFRTPAVNRPPRSWIGCSLTRRRQTRDADAQNRCR